MCEENDLFYEKENKMTQQSLNSPEYFEREKYYKNCVGCEFFSYNENGETKFMFYDGRGSNVSVLDIFGNVLYSNEYGQMGEILYSIDYSNISFSCVLYDEDLGSYIDESTGGKNPFQNFVYSISKDLLTFKKISLILKATQKSSGQGKDWVWLHLPPNLWDCFSEDGVDLGCFIDPWTDETGGGDGDMGSCQNPKDFSDCPIYCNNKSASRGCCHRMNNRCISTAYKPCKWIGVVGFLTVSPDLYYVCVGLVYFFNCDSGYQTC